MSLPSDRRVPKTCRVAAVTLALMIASGAIGQSTTAKDLPTLARETSPSVVRIVLRDQAGGELGIGSGFVIGSDGRVVTNYHVVHISGTAQAEARFTDGASYQIQGVLATDPDKDLAVLKLQAAGKEFRVVHLPNWRNLRFPIKPSWRLLATSARRCSPATRTCVRRRDGTR